jgi:hypothetical protein
MPPDFKLLRTSLEEKSADLARPLSRFMVPLMPVSQRYGVTSKRHSLEAFAIGEASWARTKPEEASRAKIPKKILWREFFIMGEIQSEIRR